MIKENYINEHKGIVYKLAHEHKHRGVDFDDLVQEGFLAMTIAYNNYNGKSKFSTYAYTLVRYAMLDALNNSKLVNLTRYDRERIRNVERLVRNGKTVEEACVELKYDLGVITFLLSRKPLRIDLDESEGVSIDLFVDESPDPHQYAVIEMKERALSDLLLELLGKRDSEIVKLRHGFKDDKIFTFKEIGNMYDITDEGARKAFNNAMKILKNNKDKVIEVWA